MLMVEDYKKTINKYKHIQQLIKTNDIIYNTNNDVSIAKRYELSFTNHRNLDMIIKDIHLVISEIYIKAFNMKNKAAIAKKRGLYRKEKN